MKIIRFINSVFSSNSFLICDDSKAILIDVGDIQPISDYLIANNLELETVFLTHTHYDHIYGIRDLLSEFPNIPIYTSLFGKEALARSNWNFSRYHEDPIEIQSSSIIPLKDNDSIIVLNSFSLNVIDTPGHDRSCLSFILDNNLFSGDSYIPNVKVIASFPNSDKKLAKEWYERLKKMTATYNLFPGHGEIYLQS